jgi:hypothetical protein
MIEYTRVESVQTNPVTTHQGRMMLPDHLERREILVDVAGKEGCREIGREITEELEYEPGKLYVNRYVRPKYVSADNRTILFDYQPGRGREGPSELLKDFRGQLQTDGYAAYNIFDTQKDVTLPHCMAHARRKFKFVLQ